jgi:FMN phosphatase YigB (HAD superfamily)
LIEKQGENSNFQDVLKSNVAGSSSFSNTSHMPGLVLFDLDNTFLDREAAFHLWGELFVSQHGLPEDAWAKIQAFDVDGYTPRDEFFETLRTSFGIEESIENLTEQYRLSYPACYSVDEVTVKSVRTLRAVGWKLGIVTNGSPSQQIKLEVTGTTNEFDGICISSVVGFRTPDPAIFHEAAELCASPLEGWMVGDSATADIGGGQAVGLRTVWMARCRTWDETLPPPDFIVETIAEAVAVILTSEEQSNSLLR